MSEAEALKRQEQVLVERVVKTIRKHMQCDGTMAHVDINVAAHKIIDIIIDGPQGSSPHPAIAPTTRKILFKETEPGQLWSIYVDGNCVEDGLRSDEMDISDYGLSALWKALGVELTFENHPEG